MGTRTLGLSELPKLQFLSYDLAKSLQIVGRTVDAEETKLSRFVKLNKKQQDFLVLFEASKNARDKKNVATGQFAQNSTNSDARSTLSDAKTSDAERSRHFPVRLQWTVINSHRADSKIHLSGGPSCFQNIYEKE